MKYSTGKYVVSAQELLLLQLLTYFLLVTFNVEDRILGVGWGGW